LGRQPEALPKYEAALKMWQRIYKGDHPDVARGLNDVASCLDNLGRSAEALPMFEAALAMWQRICKGDHPNMATAMNNLAACLDNAGRQEEALPQLEAALAMWQRIYKGDHPNVATGLNNVAYCLNYLGRPAEALPKYEAALAMRQRIFKGDHPDVAASLTSVAACLNLLGRPAVALPNYEAALAMRQRIYKEDHSDVAYGLNNLAACLDQLSRPTEALPKYQEAEAMFARLIEAQPANKSLKLGLVKSFRGRGDDLARTGDTPRATNSYQQGLQIADSLLSGGATDAQLAQLRLSLRARLGLEQVEVVVLSVVPDGQGQRIGLRKGDVLVRYAGERIVSSDLLPSQRFDSFHQLTNEVAGTKGREIELEIRRNEKVLKFTVTEGSLGVRCESRSISDPRNPSTL
jgi:tetratricopeptide (TPR) repeat protein